MKNDKPKTQESQLITEKTRKFILETTPKKFVKRRQGRGGKMLDYVETGYIISKLNEVFNYMWSFEVIEDKIGESQVYVKGKLTAHLSPDIAITKVQYGGSDIKRKADGKPVDIGDDMKAASSDALKKCASLFGIASDIFWPTGSEWREEDISNSAGSGRINTVAEQEFVEPRTPRPVTEPKTYVGENGLVHEPTEQAMDMLEYKCQVCGANLKENVYLYSMNHYKKALCYTHQQEERNK